MTQETLPLQVDMFTGQKVDTRTSTQKRRDRERAIPQQQLMFRATDVFQFGGRPRSMHQDWLDTATPCPLDLKFLDVRTPEEIERDERQAAQAHMKPLFSSLEPQPYVERETHTVGKNSSGERFDREQYALIKGLKAQVRVHHISRLVRL